MGSLLGFFPMEDDNSIIGYKAQEFVFADLAKRLGVQGPNAFIKVARMINGFSYWSPMINDKGRRDVQADMEPNDDLKHGLDASLSFIKEMMEMSVPTVGGFEGQKPRSLLPSCVWEKSGNCWSRLVTDRGLCFTSEKVRVSPTYDIFQCVLFRWPVHYKQIAIET